jgi:hypothetical protein
MTPKTNQTPRQRIEQLEREVAALRRGEPLTPEPTADDIRGMSAEQIADGIGSEKALEILNGTAA